MDTYELQLGEVVLIQDRVTVRDEKGVRDLMLTDMNIVITTTVSKMFKRDDISVNVYPVQDIKIDEYLPQIAQRDEEVVVAFDSSELDLIFSDAAAARKFTVKTIALLKPRINALKAEAAGEAPAEDPFAYTPAASQEVYHAAEAVPAAPAAKKTFAVKVKPTARKPEPEPAAAVAAAVAIEPLEDEEKVYDKEGPDFDHKTEKLVMEFHEEDDLDDEYYDDDDEEYAEEELVEEASSAPAPETAKAKAIGMSFDDQMEALKKLKALLDAEVLSPDEFEAMKKQILGV